MVAVTFDTLKALEKLKQSSFTDEQARGLIEAFRDVDTSELATRADILTVKSDIKDVRNEMREMELRLKLQIGGMIFALGGVLLAVKFLGH